MANNLTQNTIMQTLDWAYEKAITGIPGLDTAQEIGSSYIKDDIPLYDSINSLIRWQVAKCTTSGFVTGLGGIITIPIAIPANIASVMYIQLRMIAAIAHICGYDVTDDQVKSLAYICLTGNAAKDIIKEIGIKIGTQITKQAIKSISGAVITKINQAVGFRLLTRFGQTGVINLGKAIPVVGGVIGGTIDGITTNTIGNIARNLFHSPESQE